MSKLRNFGTTTEEKSSNESLSETAIQSGTQTSPTSSSSLRFNTDDEEGVKENQGRKKPGRTFEEITAEVIREMRETEAREEEKSKEKHESEEPLRVPAEEANRAPQEDPIREILDLTETDEEGVAASDEWRNQMEDKVNLLIAENAEQNAILKAQREQMTKMVDLVDRVISWMDKETQSSNQPSPAVSAAGRIVPQQNVQNTNLAGTSRKRKPTTTTSQPPSADPVSSAAKRTRDSGSRGSQKKN